MSEGLSGPRSHVLFPRIAWKPCAVAQLSMGACLAPPGQAAFLKGALALIPAAGIPLRWGWWGLGP